MSSLFPSIAPYAPALFTFGVGFGAGVLAVKTRDFHSLCGQPKSELSKTAETGARISTFHPLAPAEKRLNQKATHLKLGDAQYAQVTQKVASGVQAKSAKTPHTSERSPAHPQRVKGAEKRPFPTYEGSGYDRDCGRS